MAKIADSYSEYIEALNTELSMGKELKTDSIYDAFCKFVSNKQLLKQIIENGGFRFEYIQFINLMRDTLCPVNLLPTDTLQCKLLCKSVTDYSIVMSNLSWTIDILQCTLILRK